MASVVSSLYTQASVTELSRTKLIAPASPAALVPVGLHRLPIELDRLQPHSPVANALESGAGLAPVNSFAVGNQPSHGLTVTRNDNLFALMYVALLKALHVHRYCCCPPVT